jgi:site-specific DNA-cytosine methylase
MAERPLYTLYKNLKAQNYDVPDDYNKFESALTRDGKGGADNRHAIYENLKAQNFDVPSTYERFYSALFEPRSKTSSRAKGGSVPMSAADRARFSAGAAAISASAQQTMNNAGRYNRLKQRKQKQQKDFGRVNLGTHKTAFGGDANNVVKDDFVYNPETGKDGVYVTSDNENVYSLPEAEQSQAQDVAYQNAVDTGEIPSAFDVRDKNGNYDLQENIGKNGTYLTEEGAQKQFDKKLADAYARKKEIEALIAEDNRQHGNPLLSYGASIGAGNGRTAEQSDYRNKLATSLALVTEQIGALEAVKQYPTSSWSEDALKALDNTAFTAKTWDFGLTDFATMGQMERIKTKMDNSIPLSGSDKMLLKSKLGADAAAALEDEKMGNIYRWTKIAGQSLPFMADFFLTGGYGGITKGISRGALKFAAKRGMGKVSAAILKNTGIVAGDVIGSYAMAGTEQALKTGADIMQRHLGNLYQDDKGDYKFGTFDENGNLLHEGGESMGTALYKGMTSAMVENYTEKLFGHNYGIKKGAVNFMEKHGMNASAEFFKNIGKSGWYTNSKKWMEKFGINGFAEEVMEEEIGIPLHALLDGEGKVSDLLDAKQQLDIIGGMAISVGSMYAMGAGSRPVKGIYNRAQYYRFRNKVNVADSDAQNLMGDNWADIKDKIDNATNEQMGSVLAGILRQRDTMSKEQINAAVNYGVNLMKMRGYNIAKTAEMNAKEITNEPTTPEEQHQSDIDNAYSEGHDADDADKHDIQIQQEDQMKTLAAALGISEQQLSAMSDEELESLTGKDDKLDQAIYDYQLSSARYQGVVDDAQDRVDLAAHQAEQRVDLYTDQSRGSVRNATIKASGGLEDCGVYIISGNIATHDDGSIDVSNSDGMILYYDPTTNSVEHADALMFAELGEELPADDVKAQAVTDAKENAIKEVAGIIDGTVEVGSQFNVTDTDGSEHTYEVLADYGDGTAAISIDGNVVENPYSLADLQQMKDLEDQKRLEAAKAEREQMEKERAAQQNQETEETQPSFDFNQILNDNGNVVLVDVLDKDGNTKYPDSRLFLIRDAGAKAKVVELKSDGTIVPHAVNKEDVATISSMSLDEYKQAMPESSMIEDNSGEESDEDSRLANLGLPKGSEVWMSGDGFGRPKANTLSKVVGIDEQGSIILEDKDGKKWSASFDYINNHRELPPLDENTNIVNEENNQSESNAEVNTPAPEQTPAMTLEDGTIVPMLEDGNPDFSKLTAAQTAELYDSQFGEDADSVISGWVSDAKKALDKASNMTVKGKTFVEQKAAKDAKEKAIADAQAAYDSAIAIRDAYNERQLAKVEDTAEGRKELIEKARRKFARLKSAVKDDAEAVSQLYRDTIGSLLHRLYDSTGIDVTDTIPLTAEEYVASNLGAHTLNYEGTETSKGVKQETGLSREDFAKTQLLAADGKGTTIDAFVHSLWKNRPSNLESLDTQDIRAALLDIINSGFKASEAKKFVENIRIAQAENILEEQKRAQENAAYAEQQKAELEAEQKAKSDEKAESEAKSEAMLDNESDNESDDLSNETDNEKINDNINDNINVPEDATDEAPLGAQRDESDLPFSAKENGKQQTTAERAADVEKNKVDDMKVVDNIVGEKTRKAFERLAKMMGANIQWQYSDKLGNGWIQETKDADGNVHRTIFITLDSSTTEGAQFIFGHEMTHQIKNLNPAAYNELTQLVLDTYGSDAFDKAVDETMQRYSDAGFSGRARDYYAEEVVADAVGEMIRDLNLAHTLAMKMSHPLLAAIHEILQKIKLAFFGTEYSDVTKNIIRSIEQAYVKTANGEVTNSETGEDVSFSLRQIPEPKKKGIGYKVFVLKDGKLYPPMVANPDGAATPVGVWLDADAAPIAGESKTGRPQVKQGGKGTQGGSGKIAYRPGWHLGVVPYAIQFNRKDAEGNKTLLPKNFVFAEVEYAADVDYQEEARQEGINPSGKYQHSLAGLKHLPTDGYYMYRTNPNPETDPWVITGAMKVNRILTRAEQAELVKNAGREPQQIQEGDIVTDDIVNSINQEIADAPKFSLKVYHGSGADFTEFDFDHMGEGAGSQAFGWGGYVTSSKKIGKDYASIKYDPDKDVEYVGKNKKTFTDMIATLFDGGIRDYNYVKNTLLEISDNDKSNISKKEEYDWFVSTKPEDWFNPNPTTNRNLYEVNIPEDNGSNYLEWEKTLTEKQINAIRDALAKNGVDISSFEKRGFKLDLPFKYVYTTVIPMMMHSKPKDVSKFLSSLGFTGIKYPAGTIMGGEEEGDTNYVIFKPEDMRITEHTKFSLKDNQGNPLNQDGTLKLDKIKSVDELTDEDFTSAFRNVELPAIPKNVDAAIGANGKPVIIKKNIFEKNWNAHKFTPAESKKVLNDALYNTDLVGHTQPTKKPNHWVAIKLDDKSPITVLEVNDNKNNVEVVGWYTLDERNLGRIKRQAERNGGELIMLTPKDDKVESLSTPPLSSAAKIDNSSETTKENGEKFSLKDEKTLAGVHNISEEKLLKAIKQGGLANPSVAVIDSSRQDHKAYGGISLILPSDKIAKRTGKNAGTWQGDVYTPTYPQVERHISDKGSEQVNKDVLSVPKEMQHEVRNGIYRWLDGDANSGLKYLFLHEKGVASEPKMIQPKFSDEAYNELKFITAGDFNIYGIGKADAQKVLDMYIEAKFDGDKNLYEEKTKAWLERNKSIVDAGAKGGMRYAIAKENVELYDEYGFNYKGVQTFVRDVEYDHRKSGVDTNATLNDVEDYIKTNNLTDEFNTWLEGKEKEYGIKEVIFDGFTPSGNRRYVPNTLENVSKIMKKQGRNGATGAAVSFQNFAARLMPSYGTLKDIRSKKDLLTSDRKKFDDFREKWSNVFFELGMKCQPDATGTFDDYGLARLSEAAMTSDPQAYLKKEYNVDFSDADTKRLKEMVKAIKEESPVMYFETKFERPVRFDEFSAAVVPTTTKKEVKEALKNAGVSIFEYDEKNDADRSRAFNEAINSSDNIRFSLAGERGATAADKAEERTFRMDNLSVAKDMEKNKKKAKAIKAATGWERGADGKWRYEMPDVVLRDPKEWVNKKTLTLSDIVEKPNDLFKEYPELFDAYPELKDMKILKGRAKSGGVFYNNAITLNLGDIREAIKYDMDTHYKLANNSLKKTLVHEIQHYIQDKEGFAQGGNSEIIIDKNALDAIAKLRAEKDAVAKEFYAMSPEEQQRRKYEINNRYNDLTKQIERLEKSSRIGYDGYNRLSGEVEARNVSARLNMTPEERRKSLAVSTEDVARKDQIFLGVGDVSFSLRDMADGKESGAADMAEDLKSLNTPDEVDDAIKTAIEDMPSGWQMANKKMIHIAQALGENRKAEIAGEEPKFSLKDGTLIKAGTYFSGGGLVEEGLKGIIDPVVAVEYDEKISGVYRNNFGQHIVTADVRDVDPKELVKQIDGEVEYFHASPVCKNYSQAKSNHAEVELDKETAASTAEFINAVKPKVVTIENVKGYKDSDAMKTITEALDANGYTWDADVYNAADYGGYTNRERLIVRAVRDGKLPEKPKKMARKSGWYEAVADIIPTLTEKKNGVAPWMDIRLKADGIDWRNIDKPLYVMGSAYADGKVPHAFADELLPTLRTKSGDVIVMPDGKVYRAMGRVLARVSGVSDDYKMPFSENLSHTIIGNGIPTQLTEHVIAPLLTGSDPKFSIRTYHGTGASFDKFDLSHALEGEGSESFGHGVYVTNSSKIGREYAQRAKNRKMEDLYKNMRYPDGVKGDIFKRRVFGEMVNDVATGGSVASAKEFAKKRVGADANDIQRTLENLKDREKGTEYEQNLKNRLAEYKEGLKWIDSLDEDYLTQGNANRYDVYIPDDNGENYLGWNDSQNFPLEKWYRLWEITHHGFSDNEYFKDGGARYDKDRIERIIQMKLESPENGMQKLPTLKGEELYHALEDFFDRERPSYGAELASRALSEIGFVGIKYPAGLIHGGAEEGDYNYVIFDENNANIVGNTRFSLRYDQFEHYLNQWKKDNNLPKDAKRPTIPQRNAGESAVDFLRRVDEYRKQMALWKTAPTYEQHLLSDDTALGEFNRELQRGSVLKRIALQDSMLAIRKAQEAIMKEVGVDRLNMAEDAYTAENRSHGKGKNEFEEYNNEFLQPLRKAYHQMKKILGDSYDNVRIYMMAKHGLERDAQMAFKKSLEADYEDVAQRSAAYKAYKGDMNRIINDSDLEFGRVDFTTWRQRDNALRVKYSPSYMDYRYDKNGIAYDYSGLSALFDGSDFEEAAYKLVKDIEDKYVTETHNLWDATNAATKKILRDGYKAGMMSKDTYQYVRDMYSHYIPLRGWDGTTADQVWDYIGGGNGAFNQTLKKAHGRTSIADDPIAYIENMVESGILLNNKNWVKQHLMLLAQNHPTSLLTLSKAWYVKSTDANGNEEWIPATPQITSQMNSNQVKAAIDAFEKKMEQMAQTGDATQKRDGLNIAYPQTHSEEREHEVRVMKDGEEYVIYVNGDPQLAQAMNNTRAHRVREIQSGKLDRAAAWLGRKMAAAYTSLSPLFIPSNYFRDLTMTLASTAIREDGRYNYLLRKNLATSWNLGFMLKDYQNGKLREKVSNGNATKKEQMFYDFMMNGGETGFVSSLDVEDLKKKFKNDLKDLDRWKANPVKVGHTIMDSIEFLNRMIEDSNRFAVYMTSIQYGRSIDEAVNDAKNVTLNFNRKGTGEYGWQMIRNLYLFINPAVQSLQTLGALAKHHPFKFTAVTASWLASGVLVPIVNAALMSLLGGDDDKDKYWQFTKWDRRNNLIMWVPFTHEHIKIPLAQEFRAFYGIGDMIASKMIGGELAEESWSQYAEDLLGQVVDMLPLDPTGYDGNIAVSLMPNAIRPVFELAFNVDFTGKPLFKDTEYNKYDPNFTKAYVGTPDWLVRASKMVNSIGNDYPDVQQNGIDAFGDPRYNLNNPAVVDHVLSSYLGGAYTVGSQVLGLLTKSLNDPKEIKVADIPLFSKFVSNPDDRPVTKKQGDEFWNMKENHDRAENTLSKLKKQAKVNGDYSMLERFYGSDEYKQYKQDDVKVKKYEEDKKKERAEESGEEYRPHKLNAEDIYKAHATPKDDFEDLKLKQLYTKLNGFKSAYDLLVDTAPSQSDGYYNTNKTAIDAIDEISLDKQEISELKKGFLDDGKDAYNAEDMKQIRELRKKILAVLEKANKVVVANQKAKAKK